jgi:hypothetical protein
MLMCRPHWSQVPKPIQRAVWAAWDEGRGAGTTPAHRAAIEAAVAAVAAKAARP